MKMKTVLLALSALLITHAAFAQTPPNQCTNSNLISDPEPFVWTLVDDPTDPHWTGTMEIAKATLAVGGEMITTRIYRQEGGCNSIPGPTMTMVPGNKYVLKFRNRLAYEPASEEHNVFKDPNVSNLHTHGLHISGMTPGDDVTRSFEGSAGGDFVYDIPDNHMGGTFWYHAHHHGSTFLQVSAGAFGLIVIDDQYDNIPATVSSMEERQLVIAYLDPGVAGTGGDTLITGTLNPTWTVNGRINGTLDVPVDTWVHWRVLLADRDAKLKTLSVGEQCELALMARDGVWRTEVPKPLPTNSISLTGASRADLAVRCTGSASISVGSTPVASVTVNGAPDVDPSPYNEAGITWFSERPDYLQDLRVGNPDNSETINMGARTINGSKFDHAVPTFTLNTEGVQQFRLKGATNHPFHLHIYHVQVQGNCGDFEDGEYYDVVAGNCTIRFNLTPATAYSGRTIMHCHILEHEDQGAMGWADVTLAGAQPPPVFPDGFDYSEYIGPGVPPGDPPAAPSGLSATAASSSAIDLAWTDNSGDELYFKIERSTDGASFTPHDTANADVTVYSDSGLAANTPYWYRVVATNDFGDSDPSNVASATTDQAGTATALNLGNITLSTANAGRGAKRERADVLVLDDTGSLVAGAVVTGEFTGTVTENGITGTSGSDGVAVLETSGTAKGSLSFEFCVISITKNGLDPFTADPGDACASF
ncbi:MAG: multicopper oxidase domain-containing protein [Gammaproteobacteria bacterium]|nr:multicopper oxidase domain-containing protein [Gammaproteobacteria bacterium]